MPGSLAPGAGSWCRGCGARSRARPERMSKRHMAGRPRTPQAGAHAPRCPGQPGGQEGRRSGPGSEIAVQRRTRRVHERARAGACVRGGRVGYRGLRSGAASGAAAEPRRPGRTCTRVDRISSAVASWRGRRASGHSAARTAGAVGRSLRGRMGGAGRWRSSRGSRSRDDARRPGREPSGCGRESARLGCRALKCHRPAPPAQLRADLPPPADCFSMSCRRRASQGPVRDRPHSSERGLRANALGRAATGRRGGCGGSPTAPARLWPRPGSRRSPAD